MSRPVVVLGALAFLLSATGSAAAEPPVEVTGQITDAAGVLGDGTAAAEEAVRELAAEDDLGLYVVFVSSFDSAEPSAWAERTAEMSELDERDLLLAVAEGEASYEYSWWVDEAFPLTEGGVEEIMTSEVEPRLGEGDRSAAVVTLASELQRLAETEAAADTQAEEEAAAEAAPWSATTTVLLVAGVAVVLLAAHLLSRRRSSPTSS
ncbi:TPM domain-containing protein [Blastococcus sp. SYSU DS0973]